MKALYKKYLDNSKIKILDPKRDNEKINMIMKKINDNRKIYLSLNFLSDAFDKAKYVNRFKKRESLFRRKVLKR